MTTSTQMPHSKIEGTYYPKELEGQDKDLKVSQWKEKDLGESDSEHHVEDAIDDDEEVEKRRRRSWALGRVVAGIGSSLEIAVGWLPH